MSAREIAEEGISQLLAYKIINKIYERILNKNVVFYIKKFYVKDYTQIKAKIFEFF